MEQFLFDLEVYAVALGVSPSTVIQRAGVGGGSTWRRWRDGRGSPTLVTVDKLKAYMTANPPMREAS